MDDSYRSRSRFDESQKLFKLKINSCYGRGIDLIDLIKLEISNWG